MAFRTQLASYLFAAGCVLGQRVVFKLQIPELGEQIFDADVIEAPGPLPQSLVIHVLNPVAGDVDYGRIQTKLNGEGTGYITTVSASADGKIARMDLKLRQNMCLVPGTNTVEIQATNRHGRKYYRNFLIKTREDTRNQYFTYEAKHSAGDTTGGPEIVIEQPETPVVLGAKERTKSVTIQGKVSTVNPLASLHVAGREVKADRDVVQFSQQVQVSSTDSNIVVEAVDQTGSRAAVRIPVSRAEAGKPMNIQGNRYALVIGISEYASKATLPRLATASLDARDFASALTSQAGFKKENVYVLTDSTATLAQIMNALRTFTPHAGPDELLLVFFAGYGLHDPLDPSKIYLAAHDTQLAHVPETALSVDDLKLTAKSSVKSQQALFLFDVDHALPADATTHNNNLVNDYLLRLFPDDAGKAVMVASTVGENTVEQQTGGGLFAQQLIEAARGRADANQDGVVTVREWFLQVSRAVRTASHGTQNPRFTLQQAEKPVFAMAR